MFSSTFRSPILRLIERDSSEGIERDGGPPEPRSWVHRDVSGGMKSSSASGNMPVRSSMVDS